MKELENRNLPFELALLPLIESGYQPFAHSPSKLKATTSALKHQYPNRNLVACMELHTFSSLNLEFLNESFCLLFFVNTREFLCLCLLRLIGHHR